MCARARREYPWMHVHVGMRPLVLWIVGGVRRVRRWRRASGAACTHRKNPRPLSAGSSCYSRGTCKSRSRRWRRGCAEVAPRKLLRPGSALRAPPCTTLSPARAPLAAYAPPGRGVRRKRPLAAMHRRRRQTEGSGKVAYGTRRAGLSGTATMWVEQRENRTSIAFGECIGE